METEQFASRLRLAYEGEPIDSLREVIADQTQAYAVQELNTNLWLASGRRLVGRKVGLTAPVVQQQLGVDQPDYGMLFDDMQIPQGGTVALNRLIQPRIEAEVAFVLGAAIDQPNPTLQDVVEATSHLVPALEIVDSRIRDWNITICDTVADNASSALFVLGDERVRCDSLELEEVSMRMRFEGQVVSEGVGRDCLGNPINAVRWLAEKMVALGRPLAEGDIVLSGALGKMHAVTQRGRYEAEIEGLGTVAVAFE